MGERDNFNARPIFYLGGFEPKGVEYGSENPS